MAEIIQLRRDVSTSWAIINPILAQGEMGYELDTNKFKIGDGVTPWVGLAYFASDSIQVSEIPTPSEDEEGRIIEFVGSNLPSYKNGYFYKCVSRPEKEVDVHTQTSGDMEVVSVDVYKFVDWAAGKAYDRDRANAWNALLDNGAYLYTGNGAAYWEITLNGQEFIVYNLNTLGIETSGTVYDQYGISLDFYNGDGSRFEWERVDVQPSTTVEDNLVSTSTTNALSAKQGKELKDLIDNVQSIGRFLAMWDAGTGTARYLATNFEYDQGDYFIIATVKPQEVVCTASSIYVSPNPFMADLSDFIDYVNPSGDTTITVTYSYADNKWYKDGVEFDIQSAGCPSVYVSQHPPQDGDTITFNYTDGVNYMPDGSIYTGPSQVVATDPIEISDMYFYTGSQWSYLANHQKQTAVDEQLDNSSRNPVENRVVTNALDEKMDKSPDTEVMLYIDENGDSQSLYVGEGLEIDTSDGFVLNNTNTAAEWGHITGNIRAQVDLMDLLDSDTSAVGVPQISNVYTKQLNNMSEIGEYDRYRTYKGRYSDILFTLNLNKAQILDKMNDLYVGVSRFKTNRDFAARRSHSVIRFIPKFSLMNDKRIKLDRKMYCWRYDWDETFDTVHPRRYGYFYTTEDYNGSIYTLLDNDPSVYFFYNEWTNSNYATCLNALCNDGTVVSDVWDEDYLERYEAGDIDSFVMIERENIENSYGYVQMMRCRRFIDLDGETMYLWANDWEDSSSPVYSMDPATEIPEFYGDLIESGTVADYTGYTYLDRRDDLNYCKFNSDDWSMDDLVSRLYAYTTSNGYYGKTHVQWRCYWLDYPVVPVLLRDCEVMIQKKDRGGQSIKYSPGCWVPLKEVVAEGKTDLLTDYQTIQFRLPYDSYYLWMRFTGYQKRCLYEVNRDAIIEDNETKYLPLSYKNDLSACWDWNNGSSMLGRRAFGRQRAGYRYRNDGTKVSEYIELNLYTPANITMGTVSASTPIQKRLYINASNGGSGIRD